MYESNVCSIGMCLCISTFCGAGNLYHKPQQVQLYEAWETEIIRAER